MVQRLRNILLCFGELRDKAHYLNHSFQKPWREIWASNSVLTRDEKLMAVRDNTSQQTEDSSSILPSPKDGHFQYDGMHNMVLHRQAKTLNPTLHLELNPLCPSRAYFKVSFSLFITNTQSVRDTFEKVKVNVIIYFSNKRKKLLPWTFLREYRPRAEFKAYLARC